MDIPPDNLLEDVFGRFPIFDSHMLENVSLQASTQETSQAFHEYSFDYHMLEDFSSQVTHPGTLGHLKQFMQTPRGNLLENLFGRFPIYAGKLYLKHSKNVLLEILL